MNNRCHLQLSVDVATAVLDALTDVCGVTLILVPLGVKAIFVAVVDQFEETIFADDHRILPDLAEDVDFVRMHIKMTALQLTKHVGVVVKQATFFVFVAVPTGHRLCDGQRVLAHKPFVVQILNKKHIITNLTEITSP